MANKLPSLLVFLILLAFQEMMIMEGEAAECQADSSSFKGSCVGSSNCGLICEGEGFMTGHCHHLKCICVKDCGVGKTPAQGPPFNNPTQGLPSGGGGVPSNPGGGDPANNMGPEGGDPANNMGPEGGDPANNMGPEGGDPANEAGPGEDGPPA